jgi:hypothetical protein
MNCQHWADLGADASWPGTVDDFVRLLSCVGAHCTCQDPEHQTLGARSCPAHQLLLDQRTLDHLAFARSLHDKLIASEWSDGAVSQMTAVHVPQARDVVRMSEALDHTHQGQAGERWTAAEVTRNCGHTLRFCVHPTFTGVKGNGKPRASGW